MLPDLQGTMRDLSKNPAPTTPNALSEPKEGVSLLLAFPLWNHGIYIYIRINFDSPIDLHTLFHFLQDNSAEAVGSQPIAVGVNGHDTS